MTEEEFYELISECSGREIFIKVYYYDLDAGGVT